MGALYVILFIKDINSTFKYTAPPEEVLELMHDIIPSPEMHTNVDDREFSLMFTSNTHGRLLITISRIFLIVVYSSGKFNLPQDGKGR